MQWPLLSLLLVALASLCIGSVLAYLMTTAGTFAEQTGPTSLRLAQKEYPLISPLLMCRLNPLEMNENRSVEKIVSQFISDRIAHGDAKKISVYLVDYKNGQWVGVNENDRFDPASLLKVPLMIAYFHAAEKNPKILTEQVAYNGDDQNIDEYFKSDKNIKPGRYYTINQLIESMIVNSDNTAAVLLEQSMDPAALAQVYTDIGLPVPGQAPNVEYLSAKVYAYFFRLLYNGTYLSREYSEKALALLSKSQFAGIRTTTAPGVTVAQKFGERTIYDANRRVQDRELHDCGIIYKPDSPYLLCVMSRGSDFNTLQKNIQDLSALVYKNI